MNTHKPRFLRDNQQAIAEKIVHLHYQQQAKQWQVYGERGRQISIRDTIYHLTYLAEAAENGDPLLFNEYLSWVKVLFANLDFSNDVLCQIMNYMRQVLVEELPAAEQKAVLPILDEAVTNLANIPSHLPSYLVGDEPLDELARQFLAALLQADRHRASRLVLDAVKNGTCIKAIYLQVFQRTQQEIGRLWQINQIGVAEEHFCTAATQMIMSQLYPYIFTGERKSRRAVITCTGGELHEIGARMVADFLEMSGWDTYFLGANTPRHTILQTVVNQQADILALSATMTFHVSQVSEIISGLRDLPAVSTQVLVGGYPFNLSPDLWRKVGADGYAVDAETAVVVAEKLTANHATNHTYR